MNRKLIVGALSGAILLAGAGALYQTLGQASGPDAKPAAAVAVLTPAQARTERFWTARVTTLGGTGAAGFTDGPAARSAFGDPFGVAIGSRGTVYVADGGDNNRIRTIAPDGTVATLAGGREGYADGKGAAAMFHTPSALALDHQGNLYVADTGNHAIRRVAPDGSVTTLAGNGQPGFADGSGKDARFNGPVGIAVDDAGVVYVADTYNDRIRRIAPDGTVTTVAGAGRPGVQDGPAASALFDTPSGIAVAGDGALYVADTGSHAVRRIDAAGTVSTVAAPAEGERRSPLRRPAGIAVTRDGYLYVTTGSGRVLQVAPEGAFQPLADFDRPAEPGYGSDGTVQLSSPRGVAVARDGTVVVAEGLGYTVVRLAPPVDGETAPRRVRAQAPRREQPMPWPVLPQDAPHEVVGVMGEVRGNYEGDSRDHFHMGLDVRADVGAQVVAVAAAKVTDPYPNWGYATLSEGMSVGSLSYIHMKVGRDRRDKALDERFMVVAGGRGNPERMRVRRGMRFAVGDTLGTINSMAHVHLDYFPTGGVENPLTLPFVGLRDTVAPRIQGIVLLADGGKRLGAPRIRRDRKSKAPPPARRVTVPRAVGEVDIVVDAWDQMDGNLARRRLGLYKLGYQLLMEDGTPAPGYGQPRITQVYDRLPRNQDAVKVVYAASSGITVHGSKSTQFAYALNNTLADGQVNPGTWDVSGIAPGNYTLRIFAADFAGNVATEGRDLPITVE
ncbi:NHL repeat-containing protein [Pseudoduganella umbonata]|uniref:Gluconolaconase n=1 Tax=Pseudoduganella umbonata TaxID=864828 RepID=A0A4P8HJ30_9BURK|nr:NHL repeat-containing protein [Pseudoduganella umbonata]MBB3219635.1 sugar lactone lactonase YvrE [Pseudoduganella umbonata]QCP09699.1 gluconolaconase [Pseudoduganella umbonata]